MTTQHSALPFFLAMLLCAFAGQVAFSQPSFIEFESGPVRPVALTPDGSRLLVTNIPDNTLEVFDVSAGSLSHALSVPVGMEPVAVAARTNTEAWVVNHLSDSISIVDLSATPPSVVRTLLVGDEPRDIVFAGSSGDRAFITTAHRGQHRTDASISAVTGAGDPQLTTAGVPRADVWVFDGDPNSLGATIGGTPVEILSFFSDTPRALAVSPDGNTVYAAAFHSGNETTAINETLVPDGFDAAGPSGGAPGGVPGPDDNASSDPAPETGLIVKFDGTNWQDSLGRNWDALVPFSLPDHDVFAVNANTLSHGTVYDHVGTILFNMVTNPANGKIYVTNTELPNHVRFEGPGEHGGSTVQGHLSESRISVLDPNSPAVDTQHLNLHIDYSKLHTDTPDLVDPGDMNHSLATPLQPIVSMDGSTLYVAAFGSGKIGVFDTADIEDPSFEANFDPTVESANYISTPGGPAGLVLDEGSGRLYVMTRFDNQVVVIDTTSKAVTETHPLHNPEPPAVVTGRPFLYDALLTSGNGETSCSSCHIFGDFDSLAWNLGDPDGPSSINNQPSSSILPPAGTFHPMKGPMTTQTLRGMSTHGGLHWRGDRVDGFFGIDPCTEPSGAPCDEDLSFRNFIVAFEGLVGMDGTITAGEMQLFTNFILQLQLPPNPLASLDNELRDPAAPTPSEQRGNDLFFSCGPGTTECAPLNDPGATDTVEDCDGCHNLDPANGFFGSGGEQSFEGEPQDFKVAHMRNLYQKIGMFSVSGDQVRGFGFLHDGTVDTLKTFLEAGVFALNNADERDLEAFSLAFPSDLAPIVGQQVTRTATNGAITDSRIQLMIDRCNEPFDSLILGGSTTECDLVVKGSVGGQPKGWVKQAGSQFLDDENATISDASLRALATTEGPLTYTAVPPGSGTRMGVDRDEDNALDGLDGCPAAADPGQEDFDSDGAGDVCDDDDDDDGLLDTVETETGSYGSPTDTGTHPRNPDSDGDGFDDGVEVLAGTDPTDELSFPATPTSQVPALGALGLWAALALLLGAGVWLQRRLGQGA